jgi:Ca2+-transporting ATPase
MDGLSTADVPRRRQQFGANRLPEPPRQRLLLVFARQFRNIIILLLAVAGAISYATGDHLETAAILVVIFLNAIIGFVTEWQAGRALEALRKTTHVMARVRRDGRIVSVPAEDLVVGDVVLATAGDKVPADIQLHDASALRAEESALTGESRTVLKDTHPVPAAAPVAERTSMLFLGTSVAGGHGEGVVVAVGESTELGKIGRLVTTVEDELTPLQRRLDALGRRLVWIVLAVGGVVTLAGWLRGDPFWLMMEIGITLAVAAVPEALPAVTTFILAFGVLRMARRNAIVRRLTSVETLGSTTTICSDKTGTLTMNRMTVTDLEAHHPETAIEVMVLCNEATPGNGDPTEVALLDYAEASGHDVTAMRAKYPLVRDYPFDSALKRMITVHRNGSGYLWLLKGAPGVVFDACSQIDRAAAERSNAALASRGLRVLALARKRTLSPGDDPVSGYEFTGLVGMQDPPRPGVGEAIATAKRAGIRVVMLTGDQSDTARAITRELRLSDDEEPRVMHARELSGAALDEVVVQVDAFARVSPEDKFRIVESLQKRGEVVAVTGDGVNDAPALRKADVGIAMGERGTEVAKEAADIVLADDNFSTIVAAIEGGRAIYANIEKFVHMMLSHNLAEILMIFAAILLGFPLPLLPLQVLWLNLVTDVFPAFALALEPASPRVMERPPRKRSEALLSGSLFGTVVWQGALLAAVSLAAYYWALGRYGDGPHARMIALFSLVGVQIAQTFNCRSRTSSAFAGVTRNPHMFFATATVLLLQGAALQIETLRRVLAIAPPTRDDLVVLAVTLVVPLALVEVQKALGRAFKGTSSR